MDSATLDSTAASAPADTGGSGAPASGADTGTTSTGGSPAIIESGADLLRDVPSDIFSSINSNDDEAGKDETVDTGDDETSDDLDTPDGEEDDEPSAEQELPVTEDAKPEGKDGQQPDELPEGVTRGKNSSGKPGLFVEDSRWKNIYGNHQMVQQVSELLGEPATMESLQVRNEAYMAQERLYNDLTSGDPQAQGALLNYFFDEMARAKDDGETGVDAAVPMAQTFYSTLRERSPDGYAHLRFNAARDLVDEMFTEAAERGSDNLRLSAQHFAKTLAGVDDSVADPKQVQQMVQARGLPFYTKDDMGRLKRPGADPVQALRADNARLRSQLDGRSATSQAAQRESWVQETDKAVSDAILNDAVKPALANVEKSWSKFPQQFKDLVADPLHRKVVDVIKQDKALGERIKMLKGQALRATSAQRRTELTQAIQNVYLNRAKLAVDAVKQPILSFAADTLQERVNAKHERRSAAQNRTAPSGSNGTVPRTVLPKDLVPFQNGEFDPDIAVKQARQLLG